MNFIFGKDNYIFMFIGIVLLALGFLVLSGGTSDNPIEFSPDIFNTRRLVVAPIILVLGFAVQVYAILLNPKK